MRLTAIELEWAGEEHVFDLRLGEVRKLQERTGFGPAMLAWRLQSGDWKVDDYRETILQGLIGGGKTPLEAKRLVEAWVDERPAKESLLPAQAILLSWINGAPQGKQNPPTTESETTAPADSTSGESMQSVPQPESATLA